MPICTLTSWSAFTEGERTLRGGGPWPYELEALNRNRLRAAAERAVPAGELKNYGGQYIRAESPVVKEAPRDP